MMPSGRKAANVPRNQARYSLPQTADFEPTPSLSPMDLNPITQKLAPAIKSTAIYKGVNLMDELNTGNRIEDRGLLQLDHAFDLAKYSTDNPTKRDWIDKHRVELRDALAQNDFARHLQETNQNPVSGFFDYKGESFDLRHGKELMKREHDHFLKTEQWMTPAQVKAVKSKLPTSRALGRTHPLDWTHANQPTLSQPLGEVADAWDGKKPGTRPANESDALYHYMTYPQERYQREKVVSDKQHAESERERQKQMSWFTDEELKKKFGPDLKMAAWQLGARKTANELLYGGEQFINSIRSKFGDNAIPVNHYAPKLTREEMSLEARYPGRVGISQFLTNTGLNKSAGKVIKGPNGFNRLEGFGFGQATNYVKQNEQYDDMDYGPGYNSLPYGRGEYRND